MDFRVYNALKIKPFQALLRNTPFCSLGEVGGARAEPPHNLPPAEEVVQTVLPLEWSRRKRGQDFFILFPVFGGEMATAKIQTGKGLRVEIFSRILRKKYYSSLDGLDSRNGRRTKIVFSRKMCYTWGQKLINKLKVGDM